MTLSALTYKLTLAAAPAEVSRAFTHATALRDWLCHAAQTEPRVGGRFYAYWSADYYVSGQYTALAPGNKIAFTWHGATDPAPSTVQVVIKPAAKGTSLTLTHKNLGAGRKWAATLKAMDAGWRDALENLPSVLDHGIDLRIARLPRLGIFLEAFDAEVAASLGLPIKTGLRLAGVVDGLAAHKAGLQKEDVLVKMGAVALTSFDSLGRALAGKRAGDQLPLVYYRGPRKHTVTLELSARAPLPPLPDTAAALADLARQNYTAVQAEFKRHCAKLTDAEAEHRPAPNEWNLKELIAHFIACERDLQSWLADMLNDNTVGDSLEFRPNVTPRLAAIVARYPTLPILQRELREACAETTRLLETLPPEFLARKPLLRRVFWWISEVVPAHFSGEHSDQWQKTLAAARQT